MEAAEGKPDQKDIGDGEKYDGRCERAAPAVGKHNEGGVCGARMLGNRVHEED